MMCHTIVEPKDKGGIGAADAAAGGEELGGREKRESIQREGLIAEAQELTKAKFVKKHGKEAAKFYETVNSKKK